MGIVGLLAARRVLLLAGSRGARDVFDGRIFSMARAARRG